MFTEQMQQIVQPSAGNVQIYIYLLHSRDVMTFRLKGKKINFKSNSILKTLLDFKAEVVHKTPKGKSGIGLV